MRKLMLSAALCATVVLALAPAAGATSYAYGSCAEIPTQEQAQGLLEDPAYGTGEAPGAPTDALNLDPDADGVACNNPGNTVGVESPEVPSGLVCANLASDPEEAQARAQAILGEDPSDPNGLDADGDGVACEFEASPTGEVAFEDGSGTVVDSAAPAPQQYEQASDLDCLDFSSSDEAQAALEADESDPNDLDADGDGLACEETFIAPPTQADAPTSPGRCEDFVAQTGSEIACEPLVEEPTAQTAPRELQELPATGGPVVLLPALIGASLLLTCLGIQKVAPGRNESS